MVRSKRKRRVSSAPMPNAWVTHERCDQRRRQGASSKGSRRPTEISMMTMSTTGIDKQAAKQSRKQGGWVGYKKNRVVTNLFVTTTPHQINQHTAHNQKTRSAKCEKDSRTLRSGGAQTSSKRKILKDFLYNVRSKTNEPFQNERAILQNAS